MVQKDAAIVFLQSDSGEGYITVDGNEGDRHVTASSFTPEKLTVTPPPTPQEELDGVEQWRRTCPCGRSAQQHNRSREFIWPLILEPWINHPNVTAILWVGTGGTETGNALVDIHYGAVNSSGRLPYDC